MVMKCELNKRATACLGSGVHSTFCNYVKRLLEAIRCLDKIENDKELSFLAKGYIPTIHTTRLIYLSRHQRDKLTS